MNRDVVKCEVLATEMKWIADKKRGQQLYKGQTMIMFFSWITVQYLPFKILVY